MQRNRCKSAVGEKLSLLNLQQSRYKSSGAETERSAFGGELCSPGALRARIRLWRIAKRAFCHGTVKNQQHFTSEP
jgi:hypothetical protein